MTDKKRKRRERVLCSYREQIAADRGRWQGGPYIGHIFQAVLPGHGTENKISGPRSNDMSRSFTMDLSEYGSFI
jgi:hypothetical protein